MAFYIPPDIPVIADRSSSRIVYADRIVVQIRRDTVWCKFVTRHRRGADTIIQASAIMTPWLFAESLAELNLHAAKAGLTISGRPKLVMH